MLTNRLNFCSKLKKVFFELVVKMKKKHFLFISSLCLFTLASEAKSTLLCNDFSNEPAVIEISGKLATVDYHDLETYFVFVKNEVYGKGIRSHFKQQGGDGSFRNLMIYKGPDGIKASKASGQFNFIECSEF